MFLNFIGYLTTSYDPDELHIEYPYLLLLLLFAFVDLDCASALCCDFIMPIISTAIFRME